MWRTLRSFWHTLLFFIWGIGIAFLVNFLGALEFLEAQWPWVSLAFIVLWGCLFWLAKPYRGSRNADFRAVRGDMDEHEDEVRRVRQERRTPPWVEKFAQDKKQGGRKAS
jgi:hypothetical protein